MIAHKITSFLACVCHTSGFSSDVIALFCPTRVWDNFICYPVVPSRTRKLWRRDGELRGSERSERQWNWSVALGYMAAEGWVHMVNREIRVLAQCSTDTTLLWKQLLWCVGNKMLKIICRVFFCFPHLQNLAYCIKQEGALEHFPSISCSCVGLEKILYLLMVCVPLPFISL